MKKWEYLGVTLGLKDLKIVDDVGEGTLRDLGLNGWEVVSVIPIQEDKYHATALLKREAQPSYKTERVWLFFGTVKVGEQLGYLRYDSGWRKVAQNYATSLDTPIQALDVDGGVVETITKDSVPF